MALFNLRWDSQRSALAALFREESFVDLTLVANGQMFKAHKLLLCASSPYLKTILESVPSHHAVLFMPHIPASDLSNVLKFIYEGEIKINRRALKSFLETAKFLKIKGMDFDLEDELLENDSSSTTNQPSTQSHGSVASNSTAVTSASEDGPNDKLKILPALLMRQHADKQESDSHQSSSSHSLSTDPLKSQNVRNNRQGLSNVPELRSINSGSNVSNVGDDSVGSIDGDQNEDLDDMMVDDSHGMISGELIDLDDEDDDVDQMHHEYDDQDEEDISILPEVSLQESDESYNINNNNSQHLQQALNKASRHGQSVNSSLSNYHNNGGQQNASKLINKSIRAGMAKSTSSSSGSGNFNEGILMRMMREPLLSSTFKPENSGGSGGTGVANFYDLGHNESVGGLRKTKRYVQCGSCSKVLSSLSALKRHMEDVHCARIQGKCIICGRVYSSRNSLLTHVYSAHKKHHDYKAVARIIRESDFEKFATV